MTKNSQIIKYLKEREIDHDWNPEFLYRISKSLDFKMWEFKQAWKELGKTFKNIFK
jgi:hypothetical protein